MTDALYSLKKLVVMELEELADAGNRKAHPRQLGMFPAERSTRTILKGLRVDIISYAQNPGGLANWNRYLQYNLLELIKLINKLEAALALNPARPNMQQQTQHRRTARILDQTFHFFTVLLRKFREDVTPGLILPARFKNLNQDYVLKLIEQVSSPRYEIDEPLLNILLVPLRRFIDPGTSVSLHSFREFCQYHWQLKKLLAQGAFSEADLENFLLLTPALKRAYFKYRVRQLEARGAEFAAIPTRINFYCSELKMQRQALCGRDPGNAATLLTHWLEPEIAYLRQLANAPAAPLPVPSAGPGTKSKIRLCLSVPELSFAVSLLMKEGIIINTNASEVLQEVAENFQTVQADNLSFKNLRRKTHGVEPATMDRIKSRLYSLLDRVCKF